MNKKKQPLLYKGWVGSTKKCGRIIVIDDPYEGGEGGDRRWRYYIKFEHTGFIKSASERSILSGAVGDPYHPKIAGVGFMGVGEYKTHNNGHKSQAFKCWENMLYRVYGEHRLSNRYSERGVSVCERWQNFQNFGPWFDDNYSDGFVLDKDILLFGNKEYSPETCVFIPQELNKFFAAMNARRNNLPVGVSKSRNKFSARIHFNGKLTLKVYDSPEEAFEFYKEAKERACKQLADRLYAENKISEEVHHQLYKWICVPYPE